MKRAAALALALTACTGGDGGLERGGCEGFCADTPTSLTVAEVEQVIAQAVQEANARGALATVAVVDRVGNVLGVFEMTGADATIDVTTGRGVTTGLDGVAVVPATLGAIAKAITGAFLSSEGNAFSTRTASQIVQEHFFPGEVNQPGGPLFGVQFSQLPCSDLSARFAGTRPSPGPHRSPLGLAADPGGFPLYKNGTVVGGVGVMADGIYGLDPDISGRDRDPDEIIALAASFGFEAPLDRRGDRITADGKPFRFADARASDLASNPAAATFAGIAGLGALQTVPGYMNTGNIVAGTAFATPASGIRAATAGDGAEFVAADAFVLVDGADANRFPPTAGTALTAAEVRQLLASALAVANRARAQIRRPYGTPMRVTISVVDADGTVLGVVRTRDAPVFGTDVSLQKARSAALFSNAGAAADLAPLTATYITGSMPTIAISDYTAALRAFLDRPTALADGAIAFSDTAIGNLARPYYPDGVVGANGPLSKPFAQWSPFSTGLQLDLVHDAIIRHVLFTLGMAADVPAGACTNPAEASLANGLQIFSGSVPIYKAGALAGGIGVSGDGIDQDNMVAFLGLHEAGQTLGTIANAAPAMRSDRLAPRGVRLRYVQCPQAPYYASDEQNVCAGK